MENIKEIDIIYTVIAGTLAMFVLTCLLVFGVIKYQKRVLSQKEALRLAEKKFQNDLLDANISATEKERAEVAKNLHDDIGMLLTVIKNNQRLLTNNISNETIVREYIKTNDNLLIEIHSIVRSISDGLMSPSLVKFGFIRALGMLCDQMNDTKQIKINFNAHGLKDRFSAKTELQLYRVCKEIINNILKHSNSSEIDLNLNFTTDLINMVITYNGKGINDEDAKVIMGKSKGLGLKSIYSRVQILDGNLKYTAPNRELAAVHIQVPVKTEINAAAG
jgi:signal transduction histidine kinase